MGEFRVGETLLDAGQVQDAVMRVAEQVNEAHDDLVVITVVPGGILMAADLVRQLTGIVEMDVISCPHTPGERQNASPIFYPQTVPIAGRHVLVVDDAIESGGTMKRLIAHLATFEPASLSTATLLVKPGRVAIEAQQFYGHELTDDDLIVGYGLPWEDRLRNLPYVAKLVRG